jgi:ABC-type Na+ efflux pump permease subunit
MTLDMAQLRRMTAIGLLIFLIAGAVLPWTFDLVANQRAFGFLLSADLIAFTMLVYVYDRESDKEVNWITLLIGGVIIGILIFFGMIMT